MDNLEAIMTPGPFLAQRCKKEEKIWRLCTTWACLHAILANHSPRNYHFLVNGLDLLIAVLPRVHGLAVLV